MKARYTASRWSLRRLCWRNGVREGSSSVMRQGPASGVAGAPGGSGFEPSARAARSRS